MATEAAPFTAMIDPDDASFAAPGRHARRHPRLLHPCTGQQAPADDRAMIRTIFESLAPQVPAGLGRFQRIAPFPIERLHVIGGGSKNALLNRFTADSIGLPVVADLRAGRRGRRQSHDSGPAAGCVTNAARNARTFIARSIPTERFTPHHDATWDRPTTASAASRTTPNNKPIKHIPT